jgi:hypothetical protein
MRRLIAITCAAMLAGPPAAADPAPPPPAPSFEHLNSPRQACRVADPASCVVLAPGYYLDEAAWAKREAELKRLQDAETRLSAENKSLRGTVATWQPGWMTLVVAIAVGAASGVYVRSKL